MYRRASRAASVDSQPKYVENPRKFPRVPVELTVELTYGTATWNALALDFGPGGCLVYAGKPLAVGERLLAVFRNRDVVGRLTVSGRVAWTRAGRCGIAFVNAGGLANAQQWFEQLLRKRPSLASAAAGTPQRIALDARVSLLLPPLTSQPLPRDETSVLSAIGSATSMRLVALHSRVPPPRFARAVYALLEKGLVTIGAGVAPVPEASPASRADAARAELHRVAAAIARDGRYGEATAATATHSGVRAHGMRSGKTSR